MAEWIQRLERAITEAVQKAPPEMRAVIEALRALRGVAQIRGERCGRARLAVALPESAATDGL